MAVEDRTDFVDTVAQAVIDKIEDRQRIAMFVEMVVARVIDLQRQEEALRASASEEGFDSPAPTTT